MLKRKLPKRRGSACFSLRPQAKPAWPWRATQNDESGTRDAPTRNEQLRCHFRDKACTTFFGSPAMSRVEVLHEISRAAGPSQQTTKRWSAQRSSEAATKSA